METETVNIKTIIITLASLFNIQIAHAQYTFEGTVLDDKKQNLDGAQVLLSQDDSIVSMILTDKKGKFYIKDLKSGEYILNISYLGYTTLDEKFFMLDRNTKSTFTLLPEITGTLGEVEIVGNRNNQMKKTATGQTFYLSETAKNSGDPYRALTEIPRLISNEAFQSVKMADGSTPLVLIDGNRMNSGITPIDPKDIESVEVIDVVNARYLRENIKSIINIKLKKKTKPYSFFQVMTRHNLPVMQGSGAVYFEVGNRKYSLYGRFASEYQYNDDSESSSRQQNENYLKTLQGKQRDNKRMLLGELQFRWMATPKDYLVAHIYGKTNTIKTKTWGEGTLETDYRRALEYASFGNDQSDIQTGSLFHKHTFAEDNTLETTLSFNKNGNRKKSFRDETYPDWKYENDYQYKNTRSSLQMNIDYSYTWNDINSLNVGSSTDYINDRIHQVSQNYPAFHHRKWNEYLYASFGSQINGKFLYMISAGYEGIWLKAADVSHHYFKPRASLSSSYIFNDHHSVELSYTLTNESPSVGTLNPYNTSTDSLVIIKGNPYLLPTSSHAADLAYTFHRNAWNITPNVHYQIYTDMVTEHGYSDQSIYTYTYGNSGVFKQMSWGVQVNYRLKGGNIYVYANRNYNYYSGQKVKKGVYLGGGVTKSFNKWTLNAYCDYSDYVYSATSRTRQLVPSSSLLQVMYNITKGFYVSVAVEQFTGIPRTVTYADDGSYHSYSYNRKNDHAFRPWILLRYTLRKNKEQRIKENKLLHSNEEGIRL